MSSRNLTAGGSQSGCRGESVSAHDLAQRGEIRRAVGCGVVDPLLKGIAEGLRARDVDGEFELYEPEGGAEIPDRVDLFEPVAPPPPIDRADDRRPRHSIHHQPPLATHHTLGRSRSPRRLDNRGAPHRRPLAAHPRRMTDQAQLRTGWDDPRAVVIEFQLDRRSGVPICMQLV